MALFKDFAAQMVLASATMGVRSVHRAGEGCRLSDSADWYQG